MWDWLSENSSAVQAVMSGLTAAVWVFYLQILVSGLRRQRRTEILIHLGGSRDLGARTFVSNLGFEPIYVLEIILTIMTEDGESKTSIADRTELAKEELQSPSGTTLQGPLKSGEYVDIGSFENILQRAQNNTISKFDVQYFKHIEIKVAAITAASSNIVAAKRIFNLDSQDGNYRIQPQTLSATQIRWWWERRKLKRQMEDEINN